ncbi:MAG: hypothetical protein ISS34_01875 [Candidatus Omnitrophica bacterium]|nr:hypothetical protein [Candidatus Omnitrophota bacterium]
MRMKIVGTILAVSLFCCRAAAQEGKFMPPEGKVLFFVGQDIDTIDAYIGSTGITPAGLMAYTSIQRMEGISEPVDDGAGIHHLEYLVKKYPDTVIQIGLYMVGALDGVLEGHGDQSIDFLGKWMKEFGRPVYLRIGYEFDYPGNGYESGRYKEAYRYIVDRLRKNGIENVAYVWHSYAFKTERPVMDWYPGDEYVDWFGISFFGRRNKYMDYMAELARERNKPLMIAESAPHGIGTADAGAWAGWFQEFFDFISERKVKAVCYINANWDGQKMWREEGWGDSRIQANEAIKRQWLREIKKEKYLHSSADLPGMLKQ